MGIGHRDFEFNEWIKLSEGERKEIIDNYWSSFNPEIGQVTREEIIRNLKDRIAGQLDYFEFR